MRRFVAVIAAGTMFLGVGVSNAFAKDLTGRIGVGYQNTLPETNSAVSARYWLNEQVGLQGDLGFRMLDVEGGDSQTSFGLGLSAQYVMVEEPNLNVYGTAGIAFGSVGVSTTNPTTGETATDTKTAIGFNAGLGTEWFFVGTPNLGFTTQFGMSFVSVSDVSTTISLGGGEFATFGIRYYFGGPKGPDIR